MGALKREKNVEWEKNRRDRLNLTFLELSKLLPDHDPALVISKVDILKKSIDYIKELQDKKRRIVDSCCSDALKSELEATKQMLSELKERNRELVKVLRAAEKSHPLSVTPFTPPRKWVGKLPQSAKETIDKRKSDQPEKKEIELNEKPILSSRSIVTPAKVKKKTKKQRKSAGKHLLQIKQKKTQSATTPLREINNGGLESIKNTKVPTVSIHKDTSASVCTTVSTVLSQPRTNNVTMAKSSVLTAPIMATGIQPVLHRNPTLSALGPGTLIMPDGRMVSVPASPTVLATATQIIVNRPTNQPAVILMQNLAPVKAVSRSQLRPIVPKPRRRDTTSTTYVNKVPIPAISTHTFSRSTSSSKTVSTKDNKKSSSNKNIILRKENTKSKTVSKGTEKDKHVVDQLLKDKTVEAVNKCGPNQKVSNEEKIPSTNEEPVLNSDKSSDNNKKTDFNSNTAKRKATIEEEIEISKRLKVTERINEETHNSGKALTTYTVECNNSDNVENVQESEKEPETMDNSETNSVNTCRQENVNNLNIESGAKIPQLIEQASEITATQLNNIPLQQSVCMSENQNDPLNKNDINRIQENTIQLMASPEKDITKNQDTEKQTSNIHNENVEEKQQQINIEDTTKNKKENTSTTVISGNTNETTTVQLNCSENIENLTKDAPVQTLQQNSLHSEEGKKTINSIEKGNQENKLIIQDDSQELTSLFPSDPKLQSCPDNIFREADFRDRNLFMPISHSYMDDVRLSLPHADFSNDLFSSLQVPSGGQHPESISPTAAFLLAFPLVSTSKTSELIAETDANESQHATPTTILQIGNIDPPGSDPYHHTLMIEGNVPGLQDSAAKMAKSDETVKSSTMSKQLKDANNFGKLHHMEMNELLRGESSFTRNNNCGKEKKHFSDLQDQDIFLPCNKKKVNGKHCEYPVSSEMVPQFHDKAFEFTSSTLRHSSVQTQARHITNNNQKKIFNSENVINSHNSYNSSSQPYLYNANCFSNGNDFPLSNSNYSSNNRSANDASKSTQISSNFNVAAWSTSSISATTNRIEYSATYCTNPQKPFTNQVNKNIPQKVHQNTYEEQMMKEKSTSSNNSLPKFTANFQFNNSTNINNNSHPSQDVHSYPQGSQTENVNFKLDSKTKKTKSNSQRAPVNWMTTPDVRPALPDPNLTTALSDATFQPQKQPDFNSTGNNAMLSTTNNLSSFNISSSVSNNSQSLYSNTHITGLEFQLDFAPFPEITSSSKTIRTMSSSQQNPHHYSWSPSKSSMPLLPHLDTHMIPSTLPTLVGDLALGTSTPSGPVDTFRTLGMPTTPFSMDGMGKKVDVKQDTQKQGSGKSLDKDGFANSERRNSNRNLPEYCQKSHSHQSTNTTSSFLSVSQLVDQVKSEQGSSRRGGKQTVVNKNNANVPKRNNNSHQTDKTNQTKISNNLNNSNSFQPSVHPSSVNQRKPDMHSGYQDNQNTGVGFPGGFGTQVNAPPWQQSKIQRSSIHYKGNYSAESLISDHSVATAHDHIADLPPFSVSNQFPNQYNHTPVVSSASYSGHNLPHQNIQPLEFHQNQHQNCFNFSSQNSHYSAPFNTENDFHLGLDPLYSFNPSASRNTSCQTSAHGIGKDNRSTHKRTHSSKRREEYPSTQFMQTTQGYPRGKSSLPSTSSPGHPGTTSLTNFNLSTIFPEINDKRVVPGPNTFHASGNKHSDSSGSRSNTRSDYLGSNFNPNNVAQMQQAGLTPVPPHFPPVSFANISGPTAPNNFRPQ